MFGHVKVNWFMYCWNQSTLSFNLLAGNGASQSIQWRGWNLWEWGWTWGQDFSQQGWQRKVFRLWVPWLVRTLSKSFELLWITSWPICNVAQSCTIPTCPSSHFGFDQRMDGASTIAGSRRSKKPKAKAKTKAKARAGTTNTKDWKLLHMEVKVYVIKTI